MSTIGSAVELLDASRRCGTVVSMSTLPALAAADDSDSSVLVSANPLAFSIIKVAMEAFASYLSGFLWLFSCVSVARSGEAVHQSALNC